MEEMKTEQMNQIKTNLNSLKKMQSIAIGTNDECIESTNCNISPSFRLMEINRICEQSKNDEMLLNINKNKLNNPESKINLKFTIPSIDEICSISLVSISSEYEYNMANKFKIDTKIPRDM